MLHFFLNLFSSDFKRFCSPCIPLQLVFKKYVRNVVGWCGCPGGGFAPGREVRLILVPADPVCLCVSVQVKLVQHTYSCLFGTFLCNNAKERGEKHTQERTCSVWSLLRAANKAFKNLLYSSQSESVCTPIQSPPVGEPWGLPQTASH